MMVLTLKEILRVRTMMVVVMAITSQVLTVPGEFEECFCEMQTLDLGLEQHTGVCQVLQAPRDNSSPEPKLLSFFPVSIPAHS